MKSQSSLGSVRKNSWSSQVYWFVFVSIVIVVGTFLLDPEQANNLSLNITSEALGTAASILFIQRFLDIANQKDADKTNRMISDRFRKLNQRLTEKVALNV